MDEQLRANHVYRIEWREYERGYGTRHEGYTLHESLEEARRYVQDFFDRRQERNPTGVVPDTYIAPGRDPTSGDEIEYVEVSGDLYAEVMEKSSMWQPMAVKVGS